MNIGMFGLWGMNIPGVAHGGFESIFTEVAARLAAKGHGVTIYCRASRYPEPLRLPEHRGVRLIYNRAIESKSLSTPSATLLALLHALRENRYDVYMFVNVGMGFHCALARMFGKKVALNVDGLDWQRSKWNWWGQAYFRLAAKAAMLTCNRLITDSRAMQSYYRQHFAQDTQYIPYGVDLRSSQDPRRLQEFGVEPLGYYFIASRFVPENHVDLLVEAFTRSRSGRKLLIAGSGTYISEFHQRLHSTGDPRVVFLGHVHDQDLFDELMCNSYAYLHGHSVGGTNPALLRALGCGACVLALATPFNEEVLQGHGITFIRDVQDLRDKIEYIDSHPEAAQEYRHQARDRVKEEYTWELCTKGYEKIFLQLMGPG
jgi:glycosyltransferase involved in cell wall biosynthesis